VPGGAPSWAGRCPDWTSGVWPVTLIRGTLAAAAGLQALALLRMMRRALPARFALTVRYYIGAAGLRPVGAGLGVWLARGNLDDDHEARVRVAHEVVNLLGRVGLTVAGPLVTLWPTMLRTQVVPGAEKAGRRALGLMLAGIALMLAAALTGPPYGASFGLVVYGTGLAVAGVPWWCEGRRRPRPRPGRHWPVPAGRWGRWWLCSWCC